VCSAAKVVAPSPPRAGDLVVTKEATTTTNTKIVTPNNTAVPLPSTRDDADADLDNLLASAAGGLDVHDATTTTTPSSDAGQSPAAAATKQGSPDDVRILDLDVGGNEQDKGSPVQPKNLNDRLFDTTTTTTTSNEVAPAAAKEQE